MPTVELDIANPSVHGFKFFDVLLADLKGAWRSIFLVGNDINFLNAYLNSLALLLDQPDKLAEAHNLRLARMRLEPIHMGRVAKTIPPPQRKHLYSFNMDKFLSLGSAATRETWDRLFDNLIAETTEGEYILAIKDIHIPFMEKNKNFSYIAREFFFATRGVTTLTFVAPLLWSDYAFHIEHGQFPAMSRLCRPYLFAPRPPDNPPNSNEWLAPDKNFDFTDNTDENL